MEPKYLDILHNMILEEENKLKYLRVCVSKPNPLSTKKYYLNEIKISEAKIEALQNAIENRIEG